MRPYTLTFLTTAMLATASPTFADHKECDPDDLECVCNVENIDKSKLLNFELKPTDSDLHKCELVAVADADGSISLVPNKPEDEVEDPDDDTNDNDTGSDDNSDDDNGHGNDDDGHDESNPGKDKDKDDHGHGNDPGKYDPSNPGKSKE